MNAFQRMALMAGGAQLVVMNENIFAGRFWYSVINLGFVGFFLYLSRPSRKGKSSG